MARIKLYTSENCGLCDRAKLALTGAGAAFDEVSVSDDHPYRLRTPVLEIGGVVVAEGEIGEAEIRNAITAP